MPAREVAAPVRSRGPGPEPTRAASQPRYGSPWNHLSAILRVCEARTRPFDKRPRKPEVGWFGRARPAGSGLDWPTVQHFTHAGQKLSYETYGDGSRNLVLLPGLLFPSRMHEPLAHALADRGNRVIALDLLGHGESDRPSDMWRYSMPIFAREVVALLDHLDLDEAVVGGTSLGANTTLEVASLAPARLRGMVIEMPVLDNALLACAIAFTPLLVSLTFGAPITRPFAAVLRGVPRVFGHYPNVFLDVLSREPSSSAAILQGLFFGR